MKKIVFLLIILVNICLFGKINDNLKIFSDKEIITLDKKIEEIEKKHDITIFLNTLEGEEGFVVKNPQKVIQINLNSMTDGKIKVFLNVSKDLPAIDFNDDINLFMENLSESFASGEYSTCVLELLDALDENFLSKREEEDTEIVDNDPIEMTSNKEKISIFNFNILLFLGLFLVLIGFILKLINKRK